MNPERFPSFQVEKTPKNENLEKEKNTAEVNTEYAHYNLLYNMHILPIKKEMIPSCDAFILELIGSYQAIKNQLELQGTSQENKGPLLDFLTYKALLMYKNIFETAKKERKPIFFVDLSLEALSKSKILTKTAESFSLPVLEGILGVGLIALSAKDLADIKKDEKLTRRNFIKAGIKASAQLLVAEYLMKPINIALKTDIEAAYYMSKPTPDSLLRLKNAQRLDEESGMAHYLKNTTSVKTRNNCFAQKSETVAKTLKEESGKKPNLNLAIGAGHFDIEDCFKKPEAERLREIKDDLGEDFIKQNQITRIDFLPPAEKGGQDILKLTTFEDPSFKE